MPTRARAAAVLSGHAAAQVAAGRRVWRTPDVQPWDVWLEREGLRALGRGESVPRTLGRFEEWFLWREAVAEAAADFPRPDELVEPMRRAARLLHEWGLPRTALDGDGGAESALLARTLDAAGARFAAARAEPPWRLSSRLAACSSRSIAFAGFVDLRPDRRRLVEALSASATRVVEWGAGGAQGRVRLAPAADPERELEQASSWARARLERDPSARLLVVLPDLQRRRAAVERAFADALDPSGGSAASGSPCWAVEGGRPLAACAVVTHALTAFRLVTGAIDHGRFSDWLRSPSWRSPDAASHARLDLWLRGRLGAQVDANRLLQEFRDPGAGRAPPDLHPAARELHAIVAALRPILLAGPAPLPAWAERLRAALQALGWPREETGTDEPARARRRLQDLLAELALLGGGFATLGPGEALETVEALARQSGLEAGPGDAAVTLSAAFADPVVQYDGIWVAGLHADAWPGPVRIDPFVPLAAQRRAGVPEASAAALVARGRRLLGQWMRATPDLVLSWPQAADDCALLASPLIQSLPGAEPLDGLPPLRRPAHLLRAAAPELERIADPDGVAWAVTRLAGGARAVELQMRCPQRAYAELRLGAAALESPRPGIDARERGMLLHAALEVLWSRHLRDSAQLRAVDDESLAAMIAASVDTAADAVFGRDVDRERRRAVRRERDRAQRVLAQLCEMDRERPPFRPVELEQSHTLRIEGVELRLTVDRVDELEDGSLAIIDYKAGRPRPQDWFGERIESPQLLLYLAAVGERVSTLATLHLAPGRPQARGIADREGRLDGVRAVPAVDGHDAWAAQVERWHGSIARAVRDLRDGRAAVDPLARACDFCHLHAFCRIDDAAIAGDEGGDERA